MSEEEEKLSKNSVINKEVAPEKKEREVQVTVAYIGALAVLVAAAISVFGNFVSAKLTQNNAPPSLDMFADAEGNIVDNNSLSEIENPILDKTEFNSNVRDLPIVLLNNYSRNGANTDFWVANEKARIGDQVVAAIYYHNSGGVVAKNVRLRLLSKPCPEVKSCFQVCGRVWADNIREDEIGCATLKIEGNQNHTVRWAKDTTWRPEQMIWEDRDVGFSQTGSELFVNDGLLIGDVHPGWENQGSLLAVLVVANFYGRNP